MLSPMYCETCDRIERDPIMLDGEICGQCGGFLQGMDATDFDDGQPTEQQEWNDYDADC